MNKALRVQAPDLAESRIFRRFAPSEMERRWALVRAHMAANDLQAVVALGSDDYLGGYVRWLGDRPAINAYPTVVVFHADAPMTMIEHGSVGGRQVVADHPDYSGTEEVFTTTSWRSVRNTDRHEMEIVHRVLTGRGYRRVGIIGPGGMPFAFVAGLTGSGLELVDITTFLDRCKAIKSAAEIEEIGATARMQDDIFSLVLDQIRPGMRDLDISAIAQFEGRKRGSEQGVFLVASRPLGQPTLLATPHFQNRRFERGDHLTVLIENNGPMGYYTELGRTIVLGKATSELRDSLDLAVDAQRATLAQMVAGTPCADIAAAHDRFIATHGLDPERRLYAHGQGYDLVERPLVRADEEMPLDANTNMVVHPSFVRAGAFGYICDNFIVQPAGPPRPIHETEQRIFEV